MLSKDNSGTEPLKTVDTKSLEWVARYSSTLIATMSALLYITAMGMVASYPAPAMVDMKRPGSRFRNITEDQITWIASLPLVSGIMGNLVSGYITHKLGRKAVLLYISFWYVFGWLIIAYSSTVEMLYVGRIITGLCSGITVVTVPTYIVEIAPAEIRGFLTSGVHVATALGVLCVMSFGMVLRWSWLAVSAAILITGASCLMVIMPESPPWLLSKTRKFETEDNLEFSKRKNSYEAELPDVPLSLLQQQFIIVFLREIRDPKFYKPLAIAVSLAFFQQFSGIYPLLTYNVEIFASTESSINPNVASIIVAAVHVVSSALGSVLMDSYGRRRTYMTSGCLIGLALLVLGLYSFMIEKTHLNLYDWIPLLGFIAYVISFGIGFGPMPYVMTPEMVPIYNRSAVMSIVTICMSVFGFLMTKLFEDMKTTLGVYGLYWTYGFFAISSTVFAFFFLPETKGISIDQISRSFSQKRS